MKTSSRASPFSASSSSRSLPARPTKGIPWASSCAPGASPIGDAPDAALSCSHGRYPLGSGPLNQDRPVPTGTGTEMSQAIKPPDHASLGVAIVGAGRLGSALARGLSAAGIAVEGPLGRDAAPRSEIVLLCVPDGEIEAAAARVGRPRFVGHVSGATPLGALGDGQAFGLHPLQTFAGGEGPEAFHGAGCAIAGTSPEALAIARDLAERLGMTAIEISDAERAAYHAAASIASNFLVTLQAAAERLAAGAGIDPADTRTLLGPLVRSTVENWVEQG